MLFVTVYVHGDRLDELTVVMLVGDGRGGDGVCGTVSVRTDEDGLLVERKETTVVVKTGCVTGGGGPCGTVSVLTDDDKGIEVVVEKLVVELLSVVLVQDEESLALAVQVCAHEDLNVKIGLETGAMCTRLSIEEEATELGLLGGGVYAGVDADVLGLKGRISARSQ